jgi:hypothetical protein
MRDSANEKISLDLRNTVVPILNPPVGGDQMTSCGSILTRINPSDNPVGWRISRKSEYRMLTGSGKKWIKQTNGTRITATSFQR